MTNAADAFESFITPAPRPARDWSAYQLAVFANVADGEGHTVVLARAGTGKSTTVEEAVSRVADGKKTLVVAFAKPIADELKIRLKDRGLSNAEAATLHSYGLRQIRSTFRGMQVDNDKAWKLASELFGYGNKPGDMNSTAKKALCKLVSLCKNTLAKTALDAEMLVDMYEIDPGAQFDFEVEGMRIEFVTKAMQLLEKCRLTTDCVDFDDMIWFPVVLNLRCWAFDFVFVDETQDLNACQIELALKACKRGGRIIAVGDDRQSIYGFRGADRDAMPRLITRLRAKTLKLTVCYRCGTEIVRVAREVVEDFEPAPGKESGEVFGEHGLVTYDQMVKGCMPGDFILSRTNAPLVSLCWMLIRNGKKATIQGRDIGGSLLTLIERARKKGAKTIEHFLKFMSNWSGSETKRLLAKNPPREEAVAAVLDKVACIDALCADAKSIDEVVAKIEALFSQSEKDTSRIVLSTTHRAKGLERDRVWVLAETYRTRPSIEEDNLYYVAVTRAKKELNFVANPPKNVEDQ